MRQNLGGPRGDLAIIRCRLISLAYVANNTFHLWLNTSFEEKNIIAPEALKHAPQGVRDILENRVSVPMWCKHIQYISQKHENFRYWPNKSHDVTIETPTNHSSTRRDIVFHSVENSVGIVRRFEFRKRARVSNTL